MLPHLPTSSLCGEVFIVYRQDNNNDFTTLLSPVPFSTAFLEFLSSILYQLSLSSFFPAYLSSNPAACLSSEFLSGLPPIDLEQQNRDNRWNYSPQLATQKLVEDAARDQCQSLSQELQDSQEDFKNRIKLQARYLQHGLCWGSQKWSENGTRAAKPRNWSRHKVGRARVEVK